NDRQDQSGLYFEPAVLARGGLGAIADEQLKALLNQRPMTISHASQLEQERLAAVAKTLRGVDLVVVDRADAQALALTLGIDEDDRLRAYLSKELSSLNSGSHRRRGSPDVYIVEGDGDARSKQLESAAQDAAASPTILLFTLGSRLGVTLQRLLVDVHDAWRPTGFDPIVKGLVVHAHPEDSRAWAAVRNAFWHGAQSTLVALWLTYLPHRSPLDDERLLLETAAKRKMPKAVRSVLEPRLADLQANAATGAHVRPFWSSDGPPSLRRTSRYGDQLIDRVTLVAVGSAMQRSRLINRPGGGPFWYKFDVPKIFRSYFDGLIHASAMRWLQPREGWWGATDEDQKLLVVEAMNQAPGDWNLVLPEMLLASALGKVPEVMYEELLPAADRAMKSTMSPAAKAWVRLGLHLIDA
ncbi:MAG: hypothetical protein KF703_16695, partial [Actinobacteria bacterium]|nr:hypothetical protein [Actinomycetota bacterium]